MKTNKERGGRRLQKETVWNVLALLQSGSNVIQLTHTYAVQYALLVPEKATIISSNTANSSKRWSEHKHSLVCACFSYAWAKAFGLEEYF
jgi:hypothetical protein